MSPSFILNFSPAVYQPRHSLGKIKATQTENHEKLLGYFKCMTKKFFC